MSNDATGYEMQTGQLYDEGFIIRASFVEFDNEKDEEGRETALEELWFPSREEANEKMREMKALDSYNVIALVLIEDDRWLIYEKQENGSWIESEEEGYSSEDEKDDEDDEDDVDGLFVESHQRCFKHGFVVTAQYFDSEGEEIAKTDHWFLDEERAKATLSELKRSGKFNSLNFACIHTKTMIDYTLKQKKGQKKKTWLAKKTRISSLTD